MRTRYSVTTPNAPVSTTSAASLIRTRCRRSVVATNRDGGDFWADYDLSRHWSVLDGTIGLSDSSPTTANVSWKVYNDSVLVASGTATLGGSYHLHIAVTNVLRLRLMVNDLASTKNPCSGNGSNTGTLVWGNLQLTA